MAVFLSSSTFLGADPRCINRACQNNTSPFFARKRLLSRLCVDLSVSNNGVKKRSECLGQNSSRSSGGSLLIVFSIVILGNLCDPGMNSKGPESASISSRATQVAM